MKSRNDIKGIVKACNGDEPVHIEVLANYAQVTRHGLESAHLAHWPHARFRKRTLLLLKVLDHIIHCFAQLGVEAHGIIAVDAGDEIGAAANVGLVLIAPLDPFVILVIDLH
jgi:hypothetical protein